MSQIEGTASVPTTVANPDEWDQVVRNIEGQTSRPPSATLESLTQFVSESVQLLIAADNAHDPGLLRGHFADPVLAQLIHFSGTLTGCTATAVEIRLIGTPPGPNPVVRSRVLLTVSEPNHEVSRREQFWDVQLGSTAVVTGPKNCPGCGAPLGPGSLVCPYCHADTAVAVVEPLLVVKLQRMA